MADQVLYLFLDSSVLTVHGGFNLSTRQEALEFDVSVLLPALKPPPTP